MLYATKFSVPDAFLFLLQNGKKTILLSDLEIDGGRKQAKVDEFIAFSSIEHALEKRLKNKPPIEKTIAHFFGNAASGGRQFPTVFPSAWQPNWQKEGVVVVPINGPF